MKINIFIWQLEERFYLVKWLKNEVEKVLSFSLFLDTILFGENFIR